MKDITVDLLAHKEMSIITTQLEDESLLLIINSLEKELSTKDLLEYDPEGDRKEVQQVVPVIMEYI